MFQALYFLTLKCSDDCFYEAKINTKMDYASSNLIIFRPAKFYESTEDQKTDGGGVQKTDGETDGEGVEETDGEGVEETDGGDKENYAQGLVEHKRLKKSM
ncbi:hypothetical protein TIFTF001_040820 [Ficus carica]|uniref:Uncharacterized protein n=1 Tax=Ficus carica TaxID=3494 RepID=A0AA87ZH22_FICCA|nr:hypothetical protein TIFTF001_040818 [Ficus carica]GMN26214.1 hypothetical protein TIFTF001_040820 [Ficus carica]